MIDAAPIDTPRRADSFRLSRPVKTATIDAIADGMATSVPVPQALADLQKTVSDATLVEDPAVVQGPRLARRHLGPALGLSGAAGLAVPLINPERFRQRTVAVVLCGGDLSAKQAVA